MKTPRPLLVTLAALAAPALVAAAPATRPASRPSPAAAAIAADADATAGIAKLRADLIDSYNKGDLDRLLSHLEPDAVVTWQNGEVCHGPAEVRAYYQKMLVGPGRVAQQVTVEPVVDGRNLYTGWSISQGHLNDHYVLADGKAFAFDSRFTAVLHHTKGAWRVAAFHASVDAFDNPVVGLAARRVGTIAGVAAGGAGVAVGLIVGLLLGRRRRRPDVQ